MKRKYSYCIIIFLIIFSCVAFSRIASNDFITFDDTGFIVENNHIQSGFNPESIRWAFSTIEHNYWIPLTWLSHILDWSIFGANAGGHHIVSLLLHIGVSILLFLFLYKTTKNPGYSAFAVAFFALHPLRVESVAWASERKDVLSMFFGMATLYSYACYVEKFKRSLYILCLILFCLSLMSKPTMVTLPFVLLLLDYWPLERWEATLSAPTNNCYKFAGKLLWEKTPFFLLAIVSSIITYWAQKKVGSVSSVDILPFSTQIMNAIISYCSYLCKILMPVNLGIFYPYVFSISLWKVLFFVFIILLITVFVIYYIKKLPFLFTGWFWYLGTLIPVIGLVQVGKQAMADRYTYLPSIGIAIMISWGIPLFSHRKNINKKILIPAAITVLFVLSVLTWIQCGYWQNSIKIFSHTLQVTHHNYLAYENRGLAYANIGQYLRAIDDYNKAIQYYQDIRLNNDYSSTYFNRATAYSHLGKYNDAIEDYSKAIQMNPNFTEAYNNRGNIYGQNGLYKLAIEDFNKAIDIEPHYTKAYNNRGLAYNELGEYQRAIQDFNKALNLKPDYAAAYNNRAFSYLKIGNTELSCSDAKKACSLGNCLTLQITSLCR